MTTNGKPTRKGGACPVEQTEDGRLVLNRVYAWEFLARATGIKRWSGRSWEDEHFFTPYERLGLEAFLAETDPTGQIRSLSRRYYAFAAHQKPRTFARTIHALTETIGVIKKNPDAPTSDGTGSYEVNRYIWNLERMVELWNLAQTKVPPGARRRPAAWDATLTNGAASARGSEHRDAMVAKLRAAGIPLDSAQAVHDLRLADRVDDGVYYLRRVEESVSQREATKTKREAAQKKHVEDLDKRFAELDTRIRERQPGTGKREPAGDGEKEIPATARSREDVLAHYRAKPDVALPLVEGGPRVLVLPLVETLIRHADDHEFAGNTLDRLLHRSPFFLTRPERRTLEQMRIADAKASEKGEGGKAAQSTQQTSPEWSPPS